MHPRTPLGQLLIFVVSIMIFNVIARLLGLGIQISIIGSIVISLIMTFLTRLFYQSR